MNWISRVLLDMDGVISDLDGALLKDFGVEDPSPERRSQMIAERTREMEAEHWLSLEPLNLMFWRKTLLKWKARGKKVDILTSLGGDPLGDNGMLAYHSKKFWLDQHFSGLYEGFYTVIHCTDKAEFADMTSWRNPFHTERPTPWVNLLIDDQQSNVDEFIARGGRAIFQDHHWPEKAVNEANRIMEIL